MVTMLKNKFSVWKRIKFPTFWYNCYYFTWSDTYFIQFETLLINHPSYNADYTVGNCTSITKQNVKLCRVEGLGQYQCRNKDTGISWKNKENKPLDSVNHRCWRQAVGLCSNVLCCLNWSHEQQNKHRGLALWPLLTKWKYNASFSTTFDLWLWVNADASCKKQKTSILFAVNTMLKVGVSWFNAHLTLFNSFKLLFENCPSSDCMEG